MKEKYIDRQKHKEKEEGVCDEEKEADRLSDKDRGSKIKFKIHIVVNKI